MGTVTQIGTQGRATDSEEWRIRCELAAAFRLAALFGWDDHVATHMSARLPDGSFLLNPFGLLFEEITASNLMRMDLAGNVLEIPEGLMLNPAAYGVHSSVLEGRTDANCAIHFHSRDGVAVSALKEGLLPLSQNVLNIWHDVAYHDYHGVVDAQKEKHLLQRDLGTRNIMLLRNHGTLSCGKTIGAAFYRIYTLEWACTAQIKTLSMGRELTIPTDEVIYSMTHALDPNWVDGFAAGRFWPAMLRKAQRECPGFDV